MATVLVPLFAFVRDPRALLVIGPLVGFFGTGYFSGFVVITSELFPTALRGSAMGFVYNIGRVTCSCGPVSHWKNQPARRLERRTLHYLGGIPARRSYRHRTPPARGGDGRHLRKCAP